MTNIETEERHDLYVCMRIFKIYFKLPTYIPDNLFYAFDLFLHRETIIVRGTRNFHTLSLCYSSLRVLVFFGEAK